MDKIESGERTEEGLSFGIGEQIVEGAAQYYVRTSGDVSCVLASLELPVAKDSSAVTH